MEMMDNITVPYLSVYEELILWFIKNSIYKEYLDKKYDNKVHVLNVMAQL